MIPSSLTILADITPFSAYKTPAKARYYYEIKTDADLAALPEMYAFAQEQSLPILPLWFGTNCLFDFDIFEGIILRSHYKGVSYADGILEVGSWELANSVATEVYKTYSRGELIPWVGLPGSIGGAVAGNAGCFGLESKDILLDARMVDLARGEIFTASNADFSFEYRNSVFKGRSDICILSCRFDLSKANKDNQFNQLTPEEMRELRKSKQPQGISCGSVFTNPPGQAAWALIDSCGLKGTRIGGVEISQKHGNFFIASLGVTAQDVIALITLAKDRVREQFGIELKEEVRIIRNPIIYSLWL